jgi:uncharacterized membrane protein YfcA
LPAKSGIFKLLTYKIQMVFNVLTANILTIIFIATVFRSAFGFGESLIAVPLFALWIPLDVAVPLSVLISITIAGIVVIQDWNKIHFKSAGGLIGFTLIGIPIGLLLLVKTDARIVKAVLGVVISLFSVYLLIIFRDFGWGLRNQWPSAGSLRC